MINLKVEQYCDNCPDFRPELESSEIEKIEMKNSGSERLYNHEVRCVYAGRCRHIANHLKSKSKKYDAKEKKVLDVENIRDILMQADAISCNHKELIPSYLFPEGYLVKIDFNKLAKAVYDAIYKNDKKMKAIVYTDTNAEMRVLIRHTKEFFDGEISSILSKKDRTTVTIAGCCDVHFYYSDTTKLKGIVPPKYVYSNDYGVSKYLQDKGATIVVTFEGLLKLIKGDIDKMRKM